MLISAFCTQLPVVEIELFSYISMLHLFMSPRIEFTLVIKECLFPV